jgi:hypothetical protein
MMNTWKQFGMHFLIAAPQFTATPAIQHIAPELSGRAQNTAKHSCADGKRTNNKSPVKEAQSD